MEKEKRIRIKLGNVEVEMPEKVALQNPYYRILLQQGSMETQEIEVQMPSSDTELKETKGSAELSEPVLPHKTQRRGRRRKEVED
jgi:hypothetical protein